MPGESEPHAKRRSGRDGEGVRRWSRCTCESPGEIRISHTPLRRTQLAATGPVPSEDAEAAAAWTVADLGLHRMRVGNLQATHVNRPIAAAVDHAFAHSGGAARCRRQQSARQCAHLPSASPQPAAGKALALDAAQPPLRPHSREITAPNAKPLPETAPRPYIPQGKPGSKTNGPELPTQAATEAAV